jgi:hypothetical protein
MALRNKLYYPKSHIITNLRTDGLEWMLEDGTEYKGYYHKYIDGTVLTGAVYNKSESKKLIPYISSAEQPNNVIYDKLKKRPAYRPPHNTIALPTLDDYKEGKFARYFIRRRNYTSFQDIIEIDKKQFKLWKNPKGGIDPNIYDALTLDWKLTGPLHDSIINQYHTEFGVYDTNQRLILLKEKDFPGLSNFLTDYIEFSIYSKTTPDNIKQLFG